MEISQRDRDVEIKELKSKVADLESTGKNRDEIIKEKDQKIQNLKYKIKDTQETFEVRY